MAQTKEGALKIAAGRRGIPLDEYKNRLERGQKWCGGCRVWHSRNAFGNDISRYDGLATICRDYGNRRARDKYVLVPKNERVKPGPNRIPRRDGDKLQARSRINHDVEAGIIPNPNDIHCADCGHIGDDRRHEYDHYLGYASENHYNVEAVCSFCHHNRARERGESWYSEGS